MKAILTGMNGTVAPALAKVLESAGHTVVGWDRARVPTERPEQYESFIAENRPDWFFQIATGSPDWMAGTAAICHRLGIRFLYTGSVSVFDGGKAGPFAVDHATDATDDYGRYKADCERRVLAANPEAIIARLAWQIGDAPGSNNMIDYLTRTQQEKGCIEASTGWIPSCAFLSDTVAALVHLMQAGRPGTYQLEGNPGWSFFDIVSALNRRHGGRWQVIAKQEPRKDIRMLENRVPMGTLDRRLAV